jgi:acyl-CoA synthetase (AMP-forming)/AMP-acid ligase II
MAWPELQTSFDASIHECFARAVETWREHDFILAPAEALGGAAAVSLTFGAASELVAKHAASYGQAGFGPGHRIGLALGNHPEFFLHFLALNSLGVSIVPLDLGMRDAELRQIIRLADLDLLTTWNARRERLAALTSVETPIADVYAAVFPLARRPKGAQMPSPASEAALLFTSGTTGVPKGCILSNDYFTWIGRFYLSLGGLCTFRLGQERILTPLPVTHMNALAVSFMAAMISGSCLIQLDRFHASSWWKTVRDTRATIIHYLGVMPALLLQRGDAPEAWAGHTIRFGFGAGVDPRHHAVFEQRYGFPLIEAWAMSETGAAAWITANLEPRHVGTRCIGKPPAHVEWRLVDEQGADVAIDEPGELLVRARGEDARRHFFSGYYQDSAATEDVWRDGWFHTGDIVKRDVEGSMFFVDRSKNIVRRSGENIAAVEVEGVLLQYAAVTNCCVLPVEDELRGEEVMALIELRGGAADEARARDIAGFCLSQLNYFKIPGYIAFVEALPTTASQKLQRGAIRQMGRELLARGRAFDLRDLKRKQV